MPLSKLTRSQWADQLKRLAQHLHTLSLACPTCRTMSAGDCAQCPDCNVPFHLSDVIDSYADRIILEEVALGETQGCTGMEPVPDLVRSRPELAQGADLRDI